MSDGKVEILAEIKDKTSGAIKKIQDNISNRLNKIKSDAEKVNLNPLKDSAILASKAIGIAAVDFADFGLKAAAELQAMDAQFAQVFDNLQEDARKTVEAMGKEFGMLPNRLTPAFSQMTSKFKGLGYSTKEAATMAKDAITLAADAAAFYDKSYEDANSALNSFINGNYEGGEAIGLFANETQMAAYASKKLGKDWKSLDEAGKQLVRLEYAKAMQKSAGATGQASRESMSLTNQLANAKRAVSDFAAAVMEPMLEPLVQGLAGFAQGLNVVTAKIKDFNKFMSEHKVIADLVKVAITGFAVALLAHGVVALNAYMVGLTGAGLATTAFAVAQTAASAALAFFTSPITLVIGAITALVGAFVLLVKHPDVVKAKFEEFKNYLSNFGGFLSKTIEKINTILSNPSQLAGIFDSLKASLLNVKNIFQNTFSGIDFSALYEKVKNIIPGLILRLVVGAPGLVISGLMLVNKIAEGFGTSLPELITKGGEVLTHLIQGITQALPTLTAKAVELIQGFSAWISENLPSIIEAGVAVLNSLVEGLVEALPDLIAAAFELIKALTAALIDCAPELLNAGIQLISALIDGALSLLGALLEAGAEIIGSLLSGILSLIGNLISVGIQAIRNFISGIASKISEVLAKGKEVIQNAYDGVKSKISEFFSLGVDMVKGFIGGITHKIEEVASAAANLVRKAIGAARKEADSHSPSRKMIALGEDMGTGAEIGLKNTTKNVAKAAEKLVSTSLTKAQKAAQMAITKQKQTMDKVYKIVEDTQNKVLEAQERYHKAVQQTNEKLAQTEANLTDKYNSEVEKRKNQLVSWIGLFDEVPKLKENEDPIDGGTLLDRLKEQKAVFDEWRKDISTLESKGVSSSLLDELKEMGPKAAQEIHALASMTERALSEYQGVWQSIQTSAKSQAVIDKSALAEETRANILKTRANAEKEMQAHSLEYLKTLSELKDSAVKQFADLSSQGVKLGASFVNNLINGIRTRKPEYESTVSEFEGLQKKLAIKTFNAPELTKMASETASLVSNTKDKYQDAGKNLMEGMKQGIEDGKSGVINAAVEVAKNALNKVREAMDIHSPSGVWEKDIGRWLPAGMAKGMIGSIGLVEHAANLISNASMPNLSQVMQPSVAYAGAGGSFYGSKVVDNSKTVHSNPTVIIENLNTTESMKTVREMSEDLAEHANNVKRGT